MRRHLQLLVAFSGNRAGGVNSIRRMSSYSGGGGDTPRKNILAESWSTISTEYEKVLVPRFAPWTRDALDALQSEIAKSNGRLRDVPSEALVLCCGPGHELLPIAKILGPDSKVLGTDLASGMVDAARSRVEEECRKEENRAYKDCIRVEVDDAMTPQGPYDVVFSAFGLQQLPRPIEAVGKWIDGLTPGGIGAFIYWPPNPPDVPSDHPFEVWGDLVRRKLGGQKEETPWDEDIRAAVLAAGGEVVVDRFVSYDIHWENAKAMFQGMSCAGPWHALRLRRGDVFVDGLGEELQARYPPSGALCHEFTARMIVARQRRMHNQDCDQAPPPRRDSIAILCYCQHN